MWTVLLPSGHVIESADDLDRAGEEEVATLPRPRSSTSRVKPTLLRGTPCKDRTHPRSCMTCARAARCTTAAGPGNASWTRWIAECWERKTKSECRNWSARERAHGVVSALQGRRTRPPHKSSGAGHRDHRRPGTQRPRTMALGCSHVPYVAELSAQPSLAELWLAPGHGRAPRRRRQPLCWSLEQAAEQPRRTSMSPWSTATRRPPPGAGRRRETREGPTGGWVFQLPAHAHLARMDHANRLGTEGDQWTAAEVKSRSVSGRYGSERIRGIRLLRLPLPDPTHEQADELGPVRTGAVPRAPAPIGSAQP